jgi:MarR family transcriptional regulator, temperature-dependent positive regulator of motility
MRQRIKRDREIAESQAATSQVPPTDLHPMVGVKLWHNPCWLSFRANYIAHHFNQPLYAWIVQRYKMTAPEHVVLYAVGLKDGITADDIAESSARPKNTLSRAVNSLITKKLLFRTQDRADRRRLGLHLTRMGRRIVQETVPAFVAQEQAMASALTPAEQQTLNRLLTKVILGKAYWPTIVQREPAS